MCTVYTYARMQGRMPVYYYTNYNNNNDRPKISKIDQYLNAFQNVLM